MHTVINLTPHDVHVRKNTGEMVTFPRSGTVARCTELVVTDGAIDGFNIYHKEYGDVIDLPDEQPDTLYIVSYMILQQLPNRYDLFAPGLLIRDENGVVIGCDGLQQ